MSRAVLLPTPCDPFLIKYWLENFSRYYEDDIDSLYVHLNSSIEEEVIDYIKGLLEKHDKIKYVYLDHQIEHGEAINQLLNLVEEDYLMLVEDDAYVFKKGIINYCFQLIESGQYDVVGSKRGSCSFEILEVAKQKWGLDYQGFGDQGCNFFPCFFFSKTQTLRDTDRNFGARGWKKGELVEPLDYVITNEEMAMTDTFVNTSLQLRAKGLNFAYMPQYHGMLEDLDNWQNRRGLWDGKAFWTHAGSLSSGVGGVLVNDIGVPLSKRKIDFKVREFILPPCDKSEWARRIQWWQTFYDNSDVNEIKDFREEYMKALDRLYITSGVHKKEVKLRQLAYMELGL